MVRKTIFALGFALAALVLAAPAAGAVPEPVGMLPAAEPPAQPGDSPVAPALQAAGIALLLGGGVTLVRGWVSPDPAV